jgi:hypothetical protein
MEDVIRLQRATVDEHVGQENTHNWPAVYDTFAPQESTDVVPFHAQFDGLKGISDFYQALDAAFPDFTIAAIEKGAADFKVAATRLMAAIRPSTKSPVPTFSGTGRITLRFRPKRCGGSSRFCFA